MVGGTVWKISTETDEILYAVDYNHRVERHLNGLASLDLLGRPSIMITDSHDTQVQKTRDSALISSITEILRAGGNVLLPVDAAGRCLELAIILDSYWTQNKFLSYNLVMLSSVSEVVKSYAMSQLEWMSDAMNKDFHMRGDNPFNFKFVDCAVLYIEPSFFFF